MPAYQPASKLYATLQWRAPGIPQNVLADTEGFSSPRRRYILLLHGYNVSEGGGQKTLHGFERRLRRYSAALAGDLGWLMWPGDLKVPYVGGVAFPFKVTTARRLAERIARFLSKLRSFTQAPPEIVLVAHSLGCRVTLETLRVLSDEASSANVSVLLMAAAVPVRHVEPGGSLHEAARFARRRAVMYSTSDWVLQVLFRTGESVAPGEPVWPTAVGTQGMPEKLWTESFRMIGFGHGSYWKRSETVELFSKWMGRAAPRTPHRRALPVRPPRAYRTTPGRSLSGRASG